MKTKSTQILFHGFGCTIFLLVPIIFWPGDGGISQFFSETRPLRGYLNHVLILVFFYLTFYVLIPKLYFRKKYFYFILVILLCYVVVSFVPELILPVREGGHHPAEPGHGPGYMSGGSRFLFRMGHNLVFFMAVVFFSLMLKINNRLKQMEREKLKAELSYFKAQINPHFLFNTLNSIYSLALLKDDKTPEAVVKLSGMMRYVISDTSHDYVPLEKEISYISDFIELQKIRFDETVKIKYKPCELVPGKYIAPLILIPFIENAFKYGVNPEEDSLISVSITLNNPELHLEVFNYKVHGQNNGGTEGGLGIKNARNRLAMLYPNKHRLIIEDKETEFKVDLTINLI